ncbi:brain-specific angiogenesis inhibitor 1-associated protein 2-like protein 1b isoform X2 [Clupea harengus]|uniref:BAR/IMD domain-containing adapter protein 2-like 1 n=1 Tax=Clupea harengus TaxID=7950 RepID=A0A6P8FBT5_CLUHA|nr:brain-specific angiogenesis inhibitor 1-associated protein 2-like protein 1b isoform X2 [Clupea harengus]
MDTNKIQNVMEQFNPGLRNLIILGKNYEKSVTAMTQAGKVYFDAVSKIGENAAISPVSRELGVVLMEISEAHKKVYLELEENFKRFHKDIVEELERKTEMDVKYMTATFKRYQIEHKIKQESLDRSHSDLKKLRRKSQGKNASKYENKESECLETLTQRQSDMQRFIADGCREALLEEKRRFCFLVDKHCILSDQTASFHDKSKEMLTLKLTSWQDKCSDATNMPDGIVSMIEGVRTPVAMTPQPSPQTQRHSRNNSDAPPAPSLKAQTSPLANLFSHDTASQESSTDPSGGEEGGGLQRAVSVSSGLNHMARRPRVRTIFPHTSSNNSTLLSFDEGDIITLLIPQERDGWLYGELEKNRQRGWFPTSYCHAYVEPVANNSVAHPPVRSKSVANLMQPEQEQEEEYEAPVVLPPPDYSDSPTRTVPSPAQNAHSTPTPSGTTTHKMNGISRPPFLAGGGNPFATVRLRPTVTNDRSAPVV